MAVKILKAGKPNALVEGVRYRGSCTVCGGEFECSYGDLLIALPHELADCDAILCKTKNCLSYVIVRQVEDQPGSFIPAAPSAKPLGGRGGDGDREPAATDDAGKCSRCRGMGFLGHPAPGQHGYIGTPTCPVCDGSGKASEARS